MHTEISSTVIVEIERRLAEGLTAADIAAELAITPYVVEVVANDIERSCLPPRPSRAVCWRTPHSCRLIDPGTIRSIRRMLAVNWLTSSEIAREVGVSHHAVANVACGERRVQCQRLETGERYAPEGERCPTCGSLLAIVPCRACTIREKSASVVPSR